MNSPELSLRTKVQLESFIDAVKKTKVSESNDEQTTNQTNEQPGQIQEAEPIISVDASLTSPQPTPPEQLEPLPWPSVFTFPKERLCQTNIDKILAITSSTTYDDIISEINEVVKVIFNKMRDMRMIYPQAKHYQSAAQSVFFAFPSFINLDMTVKIILNNHL